MTQTFNFPLVLSSKLVVLCHFIAALSISDPVVCGHE